ncbi:MAG: aromatic ring-hydroxylating dioxygenase subunit alpha [Burkholderiaceae bacterium]|jgi:vanillate O-demethylase monooxygenase subunit
MFLKNTWYVAAWDSEVAGEQLLARRLLGQPIVFFRGTDGTVAALEDRCCHRLAPLSHGQLEGNCLRCMYHGLVFDRAGRCVEVPGQDRISEKLRVRSYPVIERDHLVWIWMGDPARADVSQVYDSHWHDTQGWQAERGGYIHYDANAELIVDNLLDFSHLAFVHNKTIGTRKQGGVKPEVDALEQGVRVRFTTLKGAAPPFARQLSRLPETVDRFNYYTWSIPGNYFAQDSVIAPEGDGYESQSPRTMKLHTFIALTPETQTSTHYFWSTAHNEFESDAPDVTRKLTLQVAAAFDEDRIIIEAQQRSILEADGQPMIAIPADATLLRVRRRLADMLAEEQRSQSQTTTAVHENLA